MRFLLAIFLMLPATGLTAQTATLYHPGLIVTVTDDTIYCLVPMVSAFGYAVLTKKNPDSRYDTIPINKIKYLANGSNVYETITYNDGRGVKQKLMWLQEEGDINLYQEYYFDPADQRTGGSNNGGTLTFNGPPVHTCVLRKNGQTYFLSDRYFELIVQPLVADNPAIAAKVKDKKYTYDSVQQMVEDYNGAK